MPRVLLNCSTIIKGGALQVAAQVCVELARSARKGNLTYKPILSTPLAKALGGINVKLPKSTSVVAASPSRSFSSRKKVEQLEREFRPDCTLTVFGPSYARFQSPHICGVADGWVTHASLASYACLTGTRQQVNYAARAIHKGYHYRNATLWIVETETAKSGLAKRCFIPQESIHVVPNNCSDLYLRSPYKARGLDERPIRFLVFSSDYPHKNLQIVPRVAADIARIRGDLDFEFILTLPFDAPLLAKVLDLAQRFNVIDRIRNIGPIALEDGPSVYRAAAVCFMPTLLETFSATYPEAMAMQMPIVTSNLGFARDICSDAASYFEPSSSSDAALKLVEIIEQPQLAAKIVARGKQIVASLPTPRERVDAYLRIIDSVVHP